MSRTSPAALPIRASLLLWALVGGLASALAEDLPELAAADDAWAAHRYDPALAGYEAVLRAQPQHPDRDRIELRILATLTVLGRGKECLARIDRRLAEPASPLHQYHLRIQRTRAWESLSCPPVEGWRSELLGYRRAQETLDPRIPDWEAAKVLSYEFLGTVDPPLRDEVLRLNLVLAWSLGDLLSSSSEPVPRELPAGLRYDPAWPMVARIAFLLDEVERLEVDPARDRSLEAADAAATLWRRKFPVRSAAVPRWVPSHQGLLRRAIERHPQSRMAPRLFVRLIDDAWGVDDLAAAARDARLLIERWPHAEREVARARQILGWIEAVDLRFSRQEIGLPGPRSEAVLRGQNVDSLKIRTSRLDGSALLDDPDGLEELNDPWNQLCGWIARNARDRLREIGTEPRVPRPSGPHRAWECRVRLPSVPGAWFLEAEGAGHTACTLALQTALHLTLWCDAESIHAWLVDTGTGAPAADARVLLFTGRGDDRQRLSGRTGPEGWVRFPRPSEAWPVWGLAERDDQWTVASAYPEPLHLAHPGLLLWSVTDRPLYRPGQSVQYWSFARQRAGGGPPQAAAGRRLCAELQGPGGAILTRTELVTDSFGGCGGRFDLSADLPLGEYAVNWSRPGTNGGVGSARFRVEEYRRPEFDVRVVPERPWVKPSEAADLTVEATYWFGAPVADARVEYEAQVEGCFGVGPPGGSRGRGVQNPYLLMETRTGESTTDADGRARIRVDMAEMLREALASGPYSADGATCKVKVAVTDSTGRRAPAGCALLVRSVEAFSSLSCGPVVSFPGEALEWKVRVWSPDGTPHAFEGVLDVRETRLDEGGRLVHDRLVRRQRVPVGEDGVARGTWIPADPGRYHLSFAARRTPWSRGGASHTEVFVVAPGRACRSRRICGWSQITGRSPPGKPGGCSCSPVTREPRCWSGSGAAWASGTTCAPLAESRAAGIC